VHLDKLHRENKHIETFEKLSSLLRVEPFNLRLLRKRVIVSKHLRYWDACQKDCEVILKWHVMKKKGHNSGICKETIATLAEVKTIKKKEAIARAKIARGKKGLRRPRSAPAAPNKMKRRSSQEPPRKVFCCTQWQQLAES
jgi:hypothetical protein